MRAMRGRAMPNTPPRPAAQIAADGAQSIERIRTEAERLRDLGAEAKAGLEQTVRNAEMMIGQIFEAGAKSVCEKIDQIEQAVRPTIKNGNPKP